MPFSKQIEYKALYRGDLSGLKRDLEKLEKHRKRLRNTPFYIPVRLDMGHIKRDLAKVEAQMQQSMAKKTRAAASGATTPSGLHVPREALKSYDELIKKQDSLIRSQKRFDKENNLVSETQDHFLGGGRTRQEKFKHTKSGQREFAGAIETNNERLATFREHMRAIESQHGQTFGKALGAKDAIGQIDSLQAKIEDMQTLIGDRKFSSLGNEKDFHRAQDSLARTEQRLSNLTATDTQKRQERNSNQNLERSERRINQKIKANKLEEAHARKIENSKDREMQLNRILQNRIKILEKHRDRLRQIDAAAQKRGATSIADKAFKKTDQIQSKIDQVGIDRARANSREAIEGRRRALQSELNDVQAKARHELAINKQLQIRAKHLNKGKRQHQEINRLLAERQLIHMRLGNSLAAVQGRAQTQGFASIASNAKSARANSSRAAILDTQRFAAATKASGHALNFHTSNLAKNALTFAKWYGPMQLVLGVINAFTSGVEGMVKVDRQFATLRAVFRGTAEEAQMLKKDVLALGVAQGQTAETSMDAAIRWSRLGLTRTQVLEQVQTSLVGANVAEMSAADTAERLAAIYATWNLRLSETAGVLDTLNAISNRYNATNKGMLDGMVAGGAVAKQAGQDLREYAALLSVGESAGFKGREVGNTTKFVFQRLRRPETLSKLSDQLDIDLTGPSGQIKDMSQIMRELAEIYPRLSKSQQTLLLDITAGSRQAARFAVLLEGQRESQIRAAESAFDTGSALRENEKILESMEAHLNALKSTWIELFVTLGDTGVLEYIANRFRDLGDTIAYVSEGIQLIEEGYDSIKGVFTGGKEDKDDSGEIKLSSRNARNAFETSARSAFARTGLLGGLVGKKSTATRDEVEEQIAKLKAAKERAESIGLPEFLINRTSEQIEALETLLREFDTGHIQGQVQSVGRELEILRSKADGISRGEQVFLSLAKALDAGDESTAKLNKEWKQSAGLLSNLENGAKLFAENYGRISQLIERGDNKEAAKQIQLLSQGFRKAAPEVREQFIEAQREASNKLKSNLADLEKQQSKVVKAFKGLSGQQAIEKQREALKDVNDKIKETLDSITSVDTALAQMEDKTVLDSNQLANINKHLDKTMQTITMIADALESLNIQGADSADRAFNRKIEVAAFKTQSLTASRDATKERLERSKAEKKEIEDIQSDFLFRKSRHNIKSRDVAFMNPSDSDSILFQDSFREKQSRIEQLRGENFSENATIKQMGDEMQKMIEAKQKQIQQDQEALEIAERKLKEEEKLRAEAEERAAIEREAARFKESFDKGAQEANINARNFAIGTDSTSKAINQSQALINLGKKPIQLDSNSTNDILNKRAALLQNEATIAANILALRQRDADINAVIASTKERIREAEEAQTKELSKRLALASREDQLRAAMAARATQDGPLSLQEFSFLSQGTRNAINNLSPQQVQGLGSAREKIAEENGKLLGEQRKITSALAGLVPGLEEFKDKIDAFIKNNPLTAATTGIEGKALQNAFGQQKPAQININGGDININIGEQFERFTEEITEKVVNHVDTRLNTISRQVSDLMNETQESNPLDFTP